MYILTQNVFRGCKDGCQANVGRRSDREEKKGDPTENR